MRVYLMAAVAAIAITPMVAEAQRRTPRRQTSIEIRGVVPTPQVVTVRPREVPAYSRQVLVPNFYDHDFWPSLLPPYQLVPQRMITGSGLPRDTTRVGGDATRAATDTGAVRPAATTPAGTTPATPAARDTSGASGTTPARPPR